MALPSLSLGALRSAARSYSSDVAEPSSPGSPERRASTPPLVSAPPLRSRFARPVEAITLTPFEEQIQAELLKGPITHIPAIHDVLRGIRRLQSEEDAENPKVHFEQGSQSFVARVKKFRAESGAERIIITIAPVQEKEGHFKRIHTAVVIEGEKIRTCCALTARKEGIAPKELQFLQQASTLGVAPAFYGSHTYQLYKPAEGTTCEKIILLMERAGEDFFEYVNRDTAPLTNETFLKSLMFQLATALDTCAQNGIAHRDIKLENILIQFNAARELVVKLIDFGFAENLGEAGRSTGTPYTVAPELCRATDLPVVAPSLDVWSLGCVAFMLLTQCEGYPSFSLYGWNESEGRPGTALTQHADLARYKQYLTQELIDGMVAEIGARMHITEQAQDLLRRMLTVDPSTRISAAEIKDLLSAESFAFFAPTAPSECAKT